jgi:hypothetical protein
MMKRDLGRAILAGLIIGGTGLVAAAAAQAGIAQLPHYRPS